jgi:hypothetical protein
MNEIILNIISVTVTAVVLPLITWAGARLIQYLNTKIKDENTKRILSGIISIVERAVRSVLQTYVDSLKKEGRFDKEAQVKALELARSQILVELNAEAREFITTNYGDLDTFITNQIEATINLLKK